jgi:hypothetical protein
VAAKIEEEHWYGASVTLWVSSSEDKNLLDSYPLTTLLHSSGISDLNIITSPAPALFRLAVREASLHYPGAMTDPDRARGLAEAADLIEAAVETDERVWCTADAAHANALSLLGSFESRGGAYDALRRVRGRASEITVLTQPFLVCQCSLGDTTASSPTAELTVSLIGPGTYQGKPVAMMDIVQPFEVSAYRARIALDRNEVHVGEGRPPVCQSPNP